MGQNFIREIFFLKNVFLFYRIFFSKFDFLIPRTTPGTAANIFYFVAKSRKGKKKYQKINKRVLRKRRHYIGWPHPTVQTVNTKPVWCFQYSIETGNPGSFELLAQPLGNKRKLKKFPYHPLLERLIWLNKLQKCGNFVTT